MTVKMGYMLQKEERRMGGGNVSQDQTSIICIDLKSFYASVECIERGLNPFKNKPGGCRSDQIKVNNLPGNHSGYEVSWHQEPVPDP